MEAPPEISDGGRIVRGVAIAGVATSAVVILAFNLLEGQERLAQQIVRFAITCVLAYYLTRGARWSRWVCVVLFALAGLGSVAGGLSLVSTSLGGLGLIALGLVYLTAVVLLLVPR